MQIKFKINIGRSTFNHASVAIQEALFLSFVPWHQTRKPYMQWKAKKSIKHVSRIHWRMSVRLGECVGDPNLWYTAVSAGTSIYCDLLCRDVLGKFVTSRHISQMTQRIQAALEVGIDLAVMFQSHRRIKLLRFSAPLHWGRLAQLQHLHQSKQQVLTIHWNILESPHLHCANRQSLEVLRDVKGKKSLLHKSLKRSVCTPFCKCPKTISF